MVAFRLAPLDKKVLRDLWRIKWQALAIATLIAAGIAVSVMAYGAKEALTTARTAYYRETRFADVFLTTVRAPLPVARRLAAIQGVAAADSRVVAAGLSLIPGFDRPALIQLVSLPDTDAHALNRVVVTRGRLPASGRPSETLALQSFMDAAGLLLGDEIRVTTQGRILRLTIVGAALSPEFIFVPSASSIMPDEAHTGVLWLERTSLENAIDMEGAFNALSLALAPGARAPDVTRRAEAILEPYGTGPAMMRADQPSHAFLEGEFKELDRSSLIFPPIFLIVAGGLVHLAMVRLVEVQREQIGLLKAFGYSNWEAAQPFARFALAIGLAGALIGGVLGAWLAQSITALYGTHVRFPVLEPRFPIVPFLIASAAGIAAALVGAWTAVRAAAGLSPAIAMSPPSPERQGQQIIERLPLFPRRSMTARLIARRLERRPTRALWTVLGLAASLALLVGTQFLFSAIETVMEYTFYTQQRFTHQLTFVDPRGPDALGAVNRLPGVLSSRRLRIATATLSHGAATERVALIGLDADDPFLRPLREDGRLAAFHSNGLVLGEALAGKLGVGLGDVVSVQLHGEARAIAALPVTDLTLEYAGLSAYIERRALNRLIGEGDYSSGAHLIVDPAETRRLYQTIAATPGIAGVTSRDDTMSSYRRIIADAFRTSRIYYALFAAVIAFGVAYNASRISLSEQARDLATMEVLGFTHGEIATVLIGELVTLALLAIEIAPEIAGHPRLLSM